MESVAFKQAALMVNRCFMAAMRPMSHFVPHFGVALH
jgi:hypothetical protein